MNWLVMNKFFALVLTLGLFAFSESCKPGKHTLPIQGPIRMVGTDTIYHTIPPFSFTNQDGDLVNEKTIENKVYVADFFFVSCPTICRDMARNLKKVYAKFKHHEDFAILSHTVDPEHDTVARLNAYAQKLEVSTPTWHFLTGKAKDIYRIGERSYMQTAREEENEMGNYLHNGAFILIDQKRRIRGIYDGTDEAQVALLMADLPILLKK